MRTWLLSNTYYGTWLPGDERGSVTSVRDCRPGEEAGPFRFEHDMPGTPCEGPVPALRAAAVKQMKGPPIYFDLEKAEVVLAQFRETSVHRGRTILAVAILYNHFHMVVQVLDDPDPGRMLADFKAYGSRALNRRYGKPPSETWWTGKGSTRKLPDDAAIAAGNHYVLFKQPHPLIVWSPTGEPRASGARGTFGEPGALATGVSQTSGR